MNNMAKEAFPNGYAAFPTKPDAVQAEAVEEQKRHATSNTDLSGLGDIAYVATDSLLSRQSTSESILAITENNPVSDFLEGTGELFGNAIDGIGDIAGSVVEGLGSLFDGF